MYHILQGPPGNIPESCGIFEMFMFLNTKKFFIKITNMDIVIGCVSRSPHCPKYILSAFFNLSSR